MKIIYCLLLTLSNAFITKYFRAKQTKANSMHIPLKESIQIDEYKLSIQYKLTNDQSIMIQNELDQHDYRYLFCLIDKEYILNLNLYISIHNQTMKYNSYLSILVKDKYINIYGEYILNKIKPIIFQTKNMTNPYFYFYSNESIVNLFIDDSLDKLIINDPIEKHNIQFIYDNTIKDTNYISYNTTNLNKYIVNNSYVTILKFRNMTFYKAKTVSYIKDIFMYDSFN